VQSCVADHARLCIEGQSGSRNANDPDHTTGSITLSSAGEAACSIWAAVPADDTRWSQAPPLGGIDARNARIEVAYWLERGHVGGDGFTLRSSTAGVALRHPVGVVP
jgi:hypothetical protein